MDDLKKILNEKQYEAVTASDKYLRIIAGAGSGKTRVLTYRIAYLIEECGYSPNSIVAITFTNKAASEIKERINKLLGVENLRMHVSTFHSYCVRILREECKFINYPASFSVIDDDDQKKIIKDIIKELPIDENEEAALEQLKGSVALDYIAKKKNGRVDPEDDVRQTDGNAFKHLLARIYLAYEMYLQKNFAMDFDDLILKTIYIFENNEYVLSKWQNRIQHILVDEFQDVDPNQFTLLTLLAGKENEITVVGDPDQTIYTWRGADISIILNFDKVFNGTKTISLEENYRSSGNILAVANRLIEHNHNRIKKNLFTRAENGVDIATYNGENEDKEASYVIDNINDLYDGKEVFYKDCAILYRNNSQSAKLEEVLMKRGIKYKIYGGLKFYRRMEIKDAIAFLKLATNFNDDLACARLLENTGRGIGKVTLGRITNAAKDENSNIFIYLKNHLNDLQILYKPKQGSSLQSFVKQMESLADCLLFEPKNTFKIFDDFLHSCGYIDYLLSLEMDEKIDNLHKFLEQIKDYFKDENAKLDEFVQNLILMSAQDEMEEEQDDFVKLMTVHTAKGLEFDNVFVYGLVEQIFPNIRSVMESRDGIEEERRLFYVAITRARKRLYLTTSGGQSYMGTRTPSRFLSEIKFRAMQENVTIKNENNRVAASYVATNIRPGTLITHDLFGEGIVISAHEDLIDVAFKNSKFGKKTLKAGHKFVHVKG